MRNKTTGILWLWYNHGLIRLNIRSSTIMAILLQIWLIACRVLKGWLFKEWHLNGLLHVCHSNLRIVWNSHNHHRYCRICHGGILEVLTLNLGDLRRINWQIVSYRLSIETLSTRVSLLKVKIWLGLHQWNVLEATKRLGSLRWVLVTRKMLCLTLKCLLMLKTMQFSLLNQLRWTFPHKVSKSRNDHFFCSLLVQRLVFT